jgi:hypothetical protein
MPTQYQQGQVWVGSNVEGAPTVYAKPVTPAAGIIAGGGSPTVAALTPAGLAASIGSQVGTDMGGSFVLTSGTASPTGGTQVSVTFATPLPSSPASVVINVADTTSTATTTLSWAATGYSTAGFTVFGAATTANHTYLVSYQVLRQS